MREDLAQKIVVITGASAGIGRATACAFAKRGARVALLARGRDGLEAAKRDVERLGGTALVVPTDVADPEQVEAAAAQVEEKLGPIDIWVNNAMTSVFSPVHLMKPEEYRRVTEVTYLGFVYGTLAALRRMRVRGRGSIVQVGSALAFRSIPLQSAYCAAKHAIVGFTDSLRSELLHARSNVHLAVVHMPGVNTPQFDWSKTRLPRKPKPLGKIFQPEVAAEAIVFAAEHRRRSVMVGWPVFSAVEGNKIAAGLLDRYLADKGFDGQQSPQPVSPGRRDNLWEPVPGDHGAHGRFDSQAWSWSWEFWLSRKRRVLTATGLAAACLWFASRSLPWLPAMPRAPRSLT